ncbi:MAG: FecR domain-containing protein [Myxococcota bacterium]
MSLGHPRGRIDRYLARGDLSVDGEAALRAHLTACEACRAYYDEGVLLLRAARGSLEAEGLGERARLTRRARAVTAPRRASPLATWPWLVAPAAALGLALAAFLVFSPPAVLGTVVASSGGLFIDGRPVEEGARVKAGEWVHAAKGDGALLLEHNRAVLLREGARLRFDHRGQLAELEAGRARFAVEQGQGVFEVRAGEVRVTVLGTVFAVERKKEGAALVGVHEGRVRVKANNEVVLAAGEETTVSGGEAQPARAAGPRALEEDRGGQASLQRLFERAVKVPKNLKKVFRF